MAKMDRKKQKRIKEKIKGARNRENVKLVNIYIYDVIDDVF